MHFMLGVIMLSVVMLSVMAPSEVLAKHAFVCVPRVNFYPSLMLAVWST
jgi:hypothetical protein